MRRRQVRRDGVSAGLGLRRALLEELRAAPADAFDFLECAPDNWIGVGGRLGEALDELSARYPLSCHGLSLSLGGLEPLDETFLARTRRFLDRHRVALYSEHLSYCTGDGHLYDLMPIPFTAEAVRHVATRIVRVQDVLGRRNAVENVSYYASHPAAGDGHTPRRGDRSDEENSGHNRLKTVYRTHRSRNFVLVHLIEVSAFLFVELVIHHSDSGRDEQHAHDQIEHIHAVGARHPPIDIGPEPPQRADQKNHG